MGLRTVAAVLEETSSIARRHRLEGSAHRFYERFAGMCPGSPQSCALSFANASSTGLRLGE
jgi:hypothetical protein